MTSMPTVFVVDDDEQARKSVCALVRSMGLSAEDFLSAEAFLDQYDSSQSGCVLVDLRLAGISGLELQERLKAKGSRLPVILVSAYADVPVAVQAMRNGAITVLEKPYPADALADAIRTALQVDARQRDQAVRRQQFAARMATLSPRERRALDLIVAGKPNKLIARELGTSQRTVDRVRANVFRKMGVETAVALAQMVAELGSDGSPETSRSGGEKLAL